jgi:hypothetical protein
MASDGGISIDRAMKALDGSSTNASGDVALALVAALLETLVDRGEFVSGDVEVIATIAARAIEGIPDIRRDGARDLLAKIRTGKEP